MFDVKLCCRLCLKNKNLILLNLTDEDLKDFCRNISLLFCIEVKCNDEISTSICIQCIQMITNFMYYRKFCIENQSQLQISLDIQKKLKSLKHEDSDDDCRIVSVFENSSSSSNPKTNLNISTPNTSNEFNSDEEESLDLKFLQKRQAEDKNDSETKKPIKSETVVSNLFNNADSIKTSDCSPTIVLYEKNKLEIVKGVGNINDDFAIENDSSKKKIPEKRNSCQMYHLPKITRCYSINPNKLTKISDNTKEISSKTRKGKSNAETQILQSRSKRSQKIEKQKKHTKKKCYICVN